MIEKCPGKAPEMQVKQCLKVDEAIEKALAGTPIKSLRDLY
jgi:hypothetical protein